MSLVRAALRTLASTCCAVALTTVARPAAAESHRVAAVDPDEQLARALEVALSPWGATVLEVHIETPGATMPIAVDRARSIARDANADVLVWVSDSDGGHALWIYDLASDHASARALDAAPPFEPATAAAVALAVKTLLRGTVVAPPPERFGAIAPERASSPTWILGASVGAATRFTSSSLTSGRAALEASVWPAALGHRLGLALDLEDGLSAGSASTAFNGTLSDGAARVALGARLPLAEWATLEPSLGGALHLLTLDGVVFGERANVDVRRLDVAFEPRLGLDFTLLGGRLLFGPWVGATVLGRWQRFLVHGATVVDVGPVGMEGALQIALAIP
jgi:hypothetical protein